MAKIDTVYDNFNDNSFGSIWTYYDSRVQETGQEIRITTNTVSGYYFLESDYYDLDESETSILISSAGNQSLSSLEIEFQVVKDGSNRLFFTISGNVVYAFKEVGGTITQLATVSYSSSVHRYLRIREASTVTYWEYSTDGINFTTLYSGTTPFAVTSVYVNLDAGTYDDEGVTTTVKFDDFNILPDPSENIPASNPIDVKEADQKTYLYKVYDSNDTFIGVWTDVKSEFGYTQEINSAGSSVDIILGRAVDTLMPIFESWSTEDGEQITTEASEDFVFNVNSVNAVGDDSNVDLNYKIEVYVYYGSIDNWSTEDGEQITTEASEDFVLDIGAPNGRLIFTGYITEYEAIYGDNEQTRVAVYSYGAELDNYVLESSSNTTVTYNSYDPSNIAKDALDKFTAAGGLIDYNSSSVISTGTSVSYTFRVNSYLDVLKKIIELSPTDWYWRIDQANNIYYLSSKPESISHRFILGKHIKSFNVTKSIKELVNTVYFTGGDSGGSNIFIKETDATSISDYRPGLKLETDNRVTTTSGAELIAQGLISRNKDPRFRAEIEILSDVYPIEDITVGELVGFSNFNNFIDQLELQIVRVQYSPDKVSLQLDSLLPSVSKRLEDLKRNLTLQETLNNPSAPS